jgi:hypothetical protein
MPSLRRFTGALLVALFMSASASSAVFAQTQPPNAVPPRVVAPTRLPNTGEVDTSSDSVIPLSIGFALVGLGFGVRALGRKRRISLDRG